jgi:hypothetical protein
MKPSPAIMHPIRIAADYRHQGDSRWLATKAGVAGAVGALEVETAALLGRFMHSRVRSIPCDGYNSIRAIPSPCFFFRRK